MRKNNRTNKSAMILSLVILGVLVLSACGPAATPAPTQDVAMIQTEAAQTVVADMTANAPAPTQIPLPPSPRHPGATYSRTDPGSKHACGRGAHTRSR